MTADNTSQPVGEAAKWYARCVAHFGPQPRPDAQPTDTAQSGGEPVAWRWRLIGGSNGWRFSDEYPNCDYPADFEFEPLYATPPRPADTASAEYARVIEDAVAAFELVRRIICDGALEGFSSLEGDWTYRLYRSQSDTKRALEGLRALAFVPKNGGA